MRRAIFYLTYKGLYNFANGIGTQPQLLSSGMEARHPALVVQYRTLDVQVACSLLEAQTPSSRVTWQKLTKACGEESDEENWQAQHQRRCRQFCISASLLAWGLPRRRGLAGVALRGLRR